MTASQPRALIVLRLSRVTEESTSIERQREVCEKLCAERGYEIRGYAEDPDVSAGTVPPAQRPELGRWMKTPEEFDVMVFYRLDRLVRSTRDLYDVLAWAEGEDRSGHSIKLVSATEPDFDTSSPLGELTVTFSAMFAQMELHAIRERTRSSWHHLSKQGKPTGGTPPFGYRTEQDPETGEWSYTLDPEAAQLIRSINRRVLDGETLPRISEELTRTGVLSPRDRNHVANGREPKGSGWSTSSLKRTLLNPALMGNIVYRERELDRNGRPIKRKGKYVYGPEQVRRNPDGTPIVRAEPVLTPTEFHRLKTELERRGMTKQNPNRNSDSLLLHVLYCAECGKPMYQQKGFYGRVDRYRCASAQDRINGRCENGTVVMDEMDSYVESVVLDIFGESSRLERSWDPGTDHSEELEEINATLEDLTEQLGSGAFRKGTPQRERLDQRIRELADRQSELAADDSRPASWNWLPTGELFSDWWDSQSVVQRNRYLRDMGVRAVVRSEKGAKGYDLEVALGELDRMAERLDLSDKAREVFATRELLQASGALGHIKSEGASATIYAADAPGPYDGYRERGFTTFLEMSGRTIGLRPGADLEELGELLRSGSPLPDWAVEIEN